MSLALPIQCYLSLTKPGILFGNSITAAAGFALAGHFDPFSFFTMLIGLNLIMASSCVLNNCIDVEADQKMARTKRRPLPLGLIETPNAILFAAALGCLGILFLYTNPLALTMALIGFLFYVGVYTPLKYRTEYGTAIGSIAGGIPPVVGYSAASHQLDGGALCLFLILVLWQMPHFYSIAIYRQDDYAAAKIPVLPVYRGMASAKIHIFLYTIAFLCITPSLFFLHYTKTLYLVVVLSVSLGWLILAVKGFYATNDRLWGRRMFLYSLFVINSFSIAIFIS